LYGLLYTAYNKNITKVNICITSKECMYYWCTYILFGIGRLPYSTSDLFYIN